VPAASFPLVWPQVHLPHQGDGDADRRSGRSQRSWARFARRLARISHQPSLVDEDQRTLCRLRRSDGGLEIVMGTLGGSPNPPRSGCGGRSPPAPTRSPARPPTSSGRCGEKCGLAQRLIGPWWRWRPHRWSTAWQRRWVSRSPWPSFPRTARRSWRWYPRPSRRRRAALTIGVLGTRTTLLEESRQVEARSLGRAWRSRAARGGPFSLPVIFRRAALARVSHQGDSAN
jgi:hypothetical protein